MPKLTHHSETDYDFTLEYYRPDPPTLGAAIDSGTKDDNGKTRSFRGTAVVVALERHKGRTTAYIKHFPPVNLEASSPDAVPDHT